MEYADRPESARHYSGHEPAEAQASMPHGMVSRGLVGGGAGARIGTDEKRSALGRAVDYAMGQGQQLGSFINGLEHLIDRLGGGEPKPPSTANEKVPAAGSVLGALCQLQEANDQRLQALSYQLTRLEKLV